MEKNTVAGLPQRRLNEVEQEFHDFFTRLYDKGLSNQDMALALGVGEKVITALNTRLGIHRQLYSAGDLDEVLERQFGMPLEQLLRTLLVDKHMSQQQVINYLGVGRGWFADRTERFGLGRRRRHA